MKTQDTINLENALFADTVEKRTFGVPEVTIGWYGKKRVDFMKTNTKAIIWCYEIKVTKSDFHSEHGHNFEGHYNYYVMTPDLYKEVKKEIPPHVGVLVGENLKPMKRARYCKLTKEKQFNMIMYLLRSMSREVKKTWNSKSVENQQKMRRTIEYYKRLSNSYKQDIITLNKELKDAKKEVINCQTRHSLKRL